jgi:hypothetical protein
MKSLASETTDDFEEPDIRACGELNSPTRINGFDGIVATEGSGQQDV